jgi:rod shape-determining protein MreB
MFVHKIGIDLGTANSLVFIPNKGVVLNEPSVVAVSILDNKIVAIGNTAKDMLGKTPETITVYRPLRDGVIADFRVTQAMIKYFLEKTGGKLRLFRPEVMVSVPVGITSTERRAVIEATLQAGAKQAFVAKQPILAAIGAGIPINACSGHMIVDIGGGTCQVAVISLGGIVAWASARVGGDKIDQTISDYIKRKYNMAIGEQTAEEIKKKIGSATLLQDEETIEIRGRDLIAGLPRMITLGSSEITNAISDHIAEIVQTVREVLAQTPPELAADIMDHGMVLSGGGSMLRNLNVLITQVTGVPCFLADEALLCVAKGTGVVLENLDLYKKGIMSKK